MARAIIIAAAIGLAASGALVAGYLFAGHAPARDMALAERKPIWTETAWPFPTDPWGKGRAFRCDAGHCGAEIALYLRAKIGFCGCVTSIDDDDVERVADVDLLASEKSSLGAGRAFEGRWMKGRSRSYALGGHGAAGSSALAIALHERCDMVAATAAVSGDRPERHEATVIEFLNSDPVLRWAEVTLGL